MKSAFYLAVATVTFVLFLGLNRAEGQIYGIELHNSLMPASGAMGGASFTQPQDIQSAINANPAALTGFSGTQFSFGGGWAEPTYNVNQPRPLPFVGVTPYAGKSDTPGSLLGNIGLVHQAEMLGRPVTLGLGFLSNAGLGVDFRPIAAANGTHASYTALDVASSVALKVSDRLSVGTTVMVGTSFLDGPFVGSSSLQIDYAPRFSVGANYDVGCGISIGGYWQSQKSLNFNNVVRIGGIFQDIGMQHPANVGIGIANRNLMNGRLLLAADVLYKNYDDANFFRSIYHDQWILQLGAQYQMSRKLKLRAGYAFNEDPTRDTVPGSIGGIVPIGGIPAVQYIQGQFAAIPQHRLTGGVGVRDVMPGVDLDLTVGGMFNAEKTFGSTTASVKSYWIAFGFTWRCGPVANDCQASCGQEYCFQDDPIISAGK